jgi:hypothetical protein
VVGGDATVAVCVAASRPVGVLSAGTYANGHLPSCTRAANVNDCAPSGSLFARVADMQQNRVNQRVKQIDQGKVPSVVVVAAVEVFLLVSTFEFQPVESRLT